MTETSAIMLPQTSALVMDTSCINVEEAKSQEDRDFLLEKGGNILGILRRAAIDIGKEIIEIREKYDYEDLPKFYKSLGFSRSTADHFVARYNLDQAHKELFGESEEASGYINAVAGESAQRILALPNDLKEAFLADIEMGNPPTTETVREVSQRKETKLSKKEELLEQARIRKEATDEKWEAVKADPELNTSSKEYQEAKRTWQNSNESINNFEQQIADLKAEIEEEKLKAAESEEREAKTKAELQKLKFDDASTRAERIKRLTNSLTISVPQVLADLQKFFNESSHYPEDVRKHLIEQSTYLTNYIADQLDG